MENIRLLLESGADVNLDFDSMTQPPKPVTVLDVLLELKNVEEEDERFVEIEKLLRKHGARTMDDLKQDNTKNSEEL